MKNSRRTLKIMGGAVIAAAVGLYAAQARLVCGLVQQDCHRTDGGEENEALAERIERAVVEDHARHGVYRARLLRAAPDIAPRDVVDGGAVLRAEGRQVRDGHHHQPRENDAQRARKQAVELLRVDDAAARGLFAALRAIARRRLLLGRGGRAHLLGEIQLTGEPEPQVAAEFALQLVVGLSLSVPDHRDPPFAARRTVRRPCR